MPEDAEKIARASKEEMECLQLIKDLKTRKMVPSGIDLEKHGPSQSLDGIIHKMDEINRKLCGMLETEFKPVSGFVEYYMSKSKTFDDPKYERLFDIESRKTKERRVNASKLVDYSFRDRLSGFVSKRGCLKWENTKIDEFISSLTKPSTASCQNQEQASPSE
ncbi:uncharacterized protein VICG_01475 [Vittaforma corneae ATCC 50505]|uniref:Apoptosis-antagonizing transcription factor C-terminal domain-containing protein n=1 Tax=Vittaforma corneae (strain ATCC 50505) TaxID=993615 RepID=L2GKV7_VITCO|nr:uncharacterized protein VICG_01475 [Vittaforma corneae ATCC 50505]ELA41491.1 hypothetical protein VICG_01475 [Vittaforma corneae ATCC 50505]